ncbi:MAG: hypothetical protein KBA97_10260 [Methanothrix sp.]|jgi:hypothetical protein|nr:hypothetical protein [Methanothrix sp.]HOU71408.1 hypothetical protein [Methanothrix sp.]HQJ80538.1 hypothetical protein [Methanothrix sp.]
MSNEIGKLELDRIEIVFDGTGNQFIAENDKCSDECVGGTANSSAMFATN